MEVPVSAPLPSLSPLDGAFGPSTTAREQFRLGATSRSALHAPSADFFKRHFAGSLRNGQEALIGATSPEASRRGAAALASADQALSAVQALCGPRPATQPLPGGRAHTALSQEERRLMEQAVSGKLQKLRQLTRESRSSPRLGTAPCSGSSQLSEPPTKLKTKPGTPSPRTPQQPINCWSSQPESPRPASSFPLRSPIHIRSQGPSWPAGEQQHLLGPAVSWDSTNLSKTQRARLMNSVGADKKLEPSVRHSMPASMRACSAGGSDRPREAAAGGSSLHPRAASQRASRAATCPATTSAGYTTTINPGLRPTRGLIYSVFQDLDRFGEGRITYSTLEEAAVQVGMKQDQVQRLYSRLDPHTRGYITIRDWGEPQLESQLADFTRLFVKKTRGANGRHTGANEVKSLYAAIQMALFKLKLKNSGRSVGHDRLVQAFQFIDRDANGSLDRHEVLDAFGGMGIYIDEAVLDEVIRTFDRDKDGTVNYSEFISTLFPNLNHAIE